METRDQQDTERQVHDLTVIVDDLTATTVANLTAHRAELWAALTRLELICSAASLMSARNLQAAE